MIDLTTTEFHKKTGFCTSKNDVMSFLLKATHVKKQYSFDVKKLVSYVNNNFEKMMYFTVWDDKNEIEAMQIWYPNYPKYRSVALLYALNIGNLENLRLFYDFFLSSTYYDYYDEHVTCVRGKPHVLKPSVGQKKLVFFKSDLEYQSTFYPEILEIVQPNEKSKFDWVNVILGHQTYPYIVSVVVTKTDNMTLSQLAKTNPNTLITRPSQL